MVFENRNIVIPQSLLVLDTNQEVIGHSWMSNIVKQACQETSHYLQVGEMGHQLTILYKIVEVPCGIDDSHNIMELCSLVALILNRVEQALKVIV